MAPGRGLYESPDKMGLGEPKKSPHKDPFCQNIPLRGLSGVLVSHALLIAVLCQCENSSDFPQHHTSLILISQSQLETLLHA